MNHEHLNSYPAEKVRALVGLTLVALSELLAKALPELVRRRQVERTQRPDRRRAVGGGRRRRLKPYQEVLLTLVYLRHNVAHAVVGEVFGVSTDTSENTFHEVVFVLRDVCPAQRWDAEKRWKKNEPSWTPDEVERVLIDSFESPVRRPSLPARQKRVYSGKKKRHTLKSQVVTDAKGEILGFCRKVDSNNLLSTICGIFHVLLFQYVVWFIKFATEPSCQSWGGQRMRVSMAAHRQTLDNPQH